MRHTLNNVLLNYSNDDKVRETKSCYFANDGSRAKYDTDPSVNDVSLFNRPIEL